MTCRETPRVTRCVKALAVVAALACASEICAAQEAAVPATPHAAAHGRARPAQPIAIPQQFAPPQEAYASLPETAAVVAPAPSACQLQLAKVAVFRPLPLLVGPGECGAADAVLLETVILPDQTKVAVAPPATLRCTMAEEIAHWVRDDVAPTAQKLGAALRGLDNFDSYECRGRNRVRGATLSEHGRADALDVRAFKLANGDNVGLTDVNAAKDFREAIRASACARFSTVLGPGSDGSHEEHIHLDLAERRGGYKVCEWDVREPIVQAQETAAQGEAQKADAQETDAQETPPLPLDAVPLPRPRPPVSAAQDVSNAPPRRAERPRGRL